MFWAGGGGEKRRFCYNAFFCMFWAGGSFLGVGLGGFWKERPGGK